MHIAFCSSEVVSFSKTGGLADVCGALPLALEKLGIKASIVLPYYRSIEGHHTIKKVTPVVFAGKIGKEVDVYFIQNDKFFDRDGLYGDKTGDYPDNLQRFQFFCESASKFFKDKKISVDIFHCHDWQTALIPAYLKFYYHNDPFYSKTKTVLTIHNLAYQGVFKKEEYFTLGLPQGLFNPEGFEFYNQVNLLKGGILYADAVTTVSKTYANEIQTEQFGCGLAGVLKARKKAVVGILNGLDYDLWNPEKDSLIAANYTPETIEQKYVNKKELQKMCKFSPGDIPLISFVGRLSHQKGLDLIGQTIDDLAQLDIQMVFLGVGEEKYQKLLTDISRRYPKKIYAHLKFDEKFGHLVYAGSDFLLMPSVYEPCGLSQMISLRYGTIPIVFRTGGLADTITDFDLKTKKGNGFIFTDYKPEALSKIVRLAVQTHQDKKVFKNLLQNAFKCNFSWAESAKEYIKLYNQCLS